MKLFKTTSILPVAACIMLISAGLASAGPFDPAYRGAENSVHVIFDLAVEVYEPQPGQIALDKSWNTSLFETGPSTYPLYPTQPSAVDLAENTVAFLPNFIDPLGLKLMRIQMFFAAPVPAEQIVVDVLAFDSVPTNWNVIQPALIRMRQYCASRHGSGYVCPQETRWPTSSHVCVIIAWSPSVRPLPCSAPA